MPKPFPLRRFQNDSYPQEPPFRRWRRMIARRLAIFVPQCNTNRGRTPSGQPRSMLECHFRIDRNSAVTDNRPMGAGPRILVVDDNDDNRYTLKLHLDLEGYTDVATARDGEEAIALLETSAFDLVLLDVMMPKVDGFQVLAWLKDQARLQEELDAARRLQMAMVPQSFPAPSPDFPIDLCASMEPAREVGGDLYDFFITEDGMLCFLVGDVSGKGMPAALFMARTKSLIRIATELMRSRQGTSARPAEIIGRVNRELCQNNGDMMFVTLFFAMLGPENGELEFCNAGHNAPYRLNGQRLEVIEGAKGIILGIRPDAVYATGRTSLAPGESIYVFTDGVTEAADQQGELFAEARLEAVLRAGAGCSTAAEIVTSVAQAVRGFVGRALPSDDITMLAVRRLDSSAL